ncbi:DUF86 domain-containing protein [Flavimarina sp. Hel_I_48]|uniref:HepT-like ribonuclease domain-containing protein n=1 Tax=Flavimarina sp. Hel_I_48 TaxID=1392488 RepID=UPI0004DEFEE7|nr:DUF86 domain-containing protein [Flavimarina sp. Hel_I_48]
MYLEDIQFSMNEILEYTYKMDFEDFIEDRKTLYSVLMHFTIIGEAANKIPDLIQKKYNEVPWRKMYGLRNFVTHGYFAVNKKQIREIITTNLPENKKQLEHILQLERNS